MHVLPRAHPKVSSAYPLTPTRWLPHAESAASSHATLPFALFFFTSLPCLPACPSSLPSVPPALVPSLYRVAAPARKESNPRYEADLLLGAPTTPTGRVRAPSS
jgi:hypothetical protein